MSTSICPNHPPGHVWDNGLACRWCDATRTPGEAIVSGLASRRGGDRDSARALLDAYRAERDAMTVAWLVKKSREFRAAGGSERAAQAHAVAAMASKLERGAVRPNNLRMLPAANTEAWPGELDHLRNLAATLTAAADTGDLPAIRKQLAAHQRIDTARRTEAYAANGGGR